ncbi:hypothetical protein CL648_00390 [bacterium]|nr:hypothetical protein [bacterium]|tara:strand:+ start:544 stop:1482 length:939 start_codon:yes stop_codon:yes gene_type:complete
MLEPHQSTQVANQSSAPSVTQSSKKNQESTKESNPRSYFRDTVEFSVAFKWESTQLDAPAPSFFSSIIEYVGKALRPAIQIVFDPSKVDRLLSEYDHMVMQSKSPNVLIANYSLAKLNGLLAVLLAAGVDASDLDKRRRDIIKKSIEENKAKFEENEYNIELLCIVSNHKKQRKLTRSLKKVRQELSIHMEKLGQNNWYTPERITRIQLEQLVRIHASFLDEQTQTDNQLIYWYNSDTTEGIQVRISDFNPDPRHVLEKKNARIGIYFNKIKTRSHYLNRQLEHQLHTHRISSQEAEKNQRLLGLKTLGVVQ